MEFASSEAKKDYLGYQQLFRYGLQTDDDATMAIFREAQLFVQAVLFEAQVRREEELRNGGCVEFTEVLTKFPEQLFAIEALYHLSQCTVPGDDYRNVRDKAMKAMVKVVAMIEYLDKAIAVRDCEELHEEAEISPDGLIYDTCQRDVYTASWEDLTPTYHEEEGLYPHSQADEEPKFFPGQPQE